jgi:hypothetical protein
MKAFMLDTSKHKTKRALATAMQKKVSLKQNMFSIALIEIATFVPNKEK